MTDDVATIDLQTYSTTTEVSSSGICSESFVRRPRTAWAIDRLAPIVGVILAMAASPATALPDYWFQEGRRRGVVTASGVSEGMIGRPISRAQALQMARRAIERAERERLELAEWEASRGIQWEEDL